MIKNGGYTMLDLAVATYKDAAAAFNANKPIMVYDNSQVYYADGIVYDSDNDAYVITKGGKTITIDSSNNVVSSGDIQILKNHIYALTFNISDMYYTIFTTKSCGMNAKIINVGEDEARTTLSLTDDEKKALYDAYKTALYNGNTFLIGSINGDEAYEFGNYSNLNSLQFNNSDSDSYSLEIAFSSNNITITSNPSKNDITIYENQLF